MKVGLVCPYSFDVPGGVQFHIRDLTEELIARGHQVSVFAPCDELEDRPDWLVSAGKSVAIKFNGSVARLAFGPVVASKTKQWLEDGEFDVVHVHEPETPSVGMLALMNSDAPVVATFHAALDRSAVRSLTSGLVGPTLEKIAARIAVSQEARRTLIEHHAGDAVVIPNGVFCDEFAQASPLPKWEATDSRPVVVFLGRLDEPRKGLEVFAQAIPTVLERFPGVRFLVAGRGEAQALASAQAQYPDSIEILGEISDQEKQSLLKGATLYVAPQLGGESFGIVLVEAMAARTTVVASDIAAFAAVLDDGGAGRLFQVGDGEDLARALVEQLSDLGANDELAQKGQARSYRYDWGTVTEQILAVYTSVLPTTEPIKTGTVYEYVSTKLGIGNKQ